MKPICLFFFAVYVATAGWCVAEVYAANQWLLFFLLGLAASCVLALITRNDEPAEVSRPLLVLVVAAWTLLAFMQGGWHVVARAGSVYIPLLVLIPLPKTILKKRPCLASLSSALFSFQAFLLAFFIIAAAYKSLLLHTFDTSLIDRLAIHVFRFLGVPCSLLADGIYAADGIKCRPIHFGIERLHIDWLLNFSAAALCFFPRTAAGRINRRFLFQCIAFACLLNLLWVVLSFTFWYYTTALTWYVVPTNFVLITVLSSILLFPFLLRFLSLSRDADKPPSIPATRTARSAPAHGVAIALVAGLFLLTHWYPYGEKKPTDRILIDDYHSEWEWSDLAFDFSDAGLGKRPAYSYTNFVDFLRMYYPVDINHDKTFDAIDLARYSVIILKTATRPFSNEEVLAIRLFVNNGGGLFIHGDHTNLFGMSDNFNAILEPVPASFHIDDEAAFDGRPSIYERPLEAWSHPTFRSVRSFASLTGCTLASRLPLRVEPVCVTAGVFSENAVYGKPGFFGNMFMDGNDRAGYFLRACVVPYGKGRIALFTDSTVFSNFAAFQSDYMQYALRTLEYLQHYASPGRMALCVILASIFVLLFLPLFAARRIRFSQNTITFDLAAGIVIGFVLLAIVDESIEPRPIQDARRTRIAVVLGNAINKDVLEQTSSSFDENSIDFSSLIMGFQRAGFFPLLCANMQEAVDTGFDVVWINPVSKLKTPQIDRLWRAIVEHQNKIIIFDSLANQNSTVNQFLNRIYMGLQFNFTDGTVGIPAHTPDVASPGPDLISLFVELAWFDLQGGTLAVSQSEHATIQPKGMLTIAGGAPVTVDGSGNVLLANKSLGGRSEAIVCIDSIQFSNAYLGGGFMKAHADSEKANLDNLRQLISAIFAEPNKHSDKLAEAAQ